MKILSESGMKDGRKFIVFMSDDDDDPMSAKLICVTHDN